MSEPSWDLVDLSVFLDKTFPGVLDELEEFPVEPEDAARVAILLLEQLSLMLPG